MEAILKHPLLYTGPRMVKSPVLYTVGLLRALGRGIDSEAWTWLGALAGQQLFYPPNVAGWDDDRWLDTATFRARWLIASEALNPYRLEKNLPATERDPATLLTRARALLGDPPLTHGTAKALRGFTDKALGDADASWKRTQYPTLVANALRQLVAISPDYQTC
jgi:Protein of unknown function (DUF1800)